MGLRTPVFFCRMLHGRGVCRLAPPRTIAGAISALGDVVSQLLLENRDTIDTTRLLTCAALGAAVDGVLLQRWYAFLHRVPARHPTITLLQRLVLHHSGFVPLLAPFFITVASTAHALTAGTHSTGDLQTMCRVRQEWWPSVTFSWLVVAPMQLVTAW
eukprot:CAMPEP_0183353434 /NCGR_PEP_ID=MMETSP0164_2-20130417/33250_1 /TAXON_ID=221442 /ORGANISM="Coccolithus pelagicus ssp braarudi, Strain PLY182g" /LENGTH=157 /DNA_ID=CAMNT_0025526103 /DNA_START=50 /DNA_END=520 /DNA_ORIENTATION=+